MAANIHFDEQTGKSSFYSAKERAWHGLGFIADQYQSSTEVLKHSGLDFLVGKMPNVHRFPSGKEVISDSSFFTYRMDNEQVLGEVGADYTILQNVQAFSFFDAIAGKDGVFYETAGALGKGERIFITAKLPKYIKVGDDDLIEQYVFITTSHDGTESVTAAFTPIRIVCNNTLTAALRNCSCVVKIRHLANMEDQLKEAHKVMGMVNTLAPQMEEVFNAWAKVEITDKQVLHLIQMAFANKPETLENIRLGKEEENSSIYTNQVKGAFHYAMTAESQLIDTTRGTLFGAYNALTGYYQNVKEYKDVETKIKNQMYGGAGQIRGQKGFDLCLDFAKKGPAALFMN